MKRHIKRVAFDTFGWFFIVIGFVGLFLPILQGILFLIIGFYLLSLHSLWAHQKLHAFKLKHPRIGEKIDYFDRKIRKFFGIENAYDRS